MACDRLKESRAVGCVLTDRSDLIQRGRVSHKSETGNRSIGWLDSRDTTIGAWLADGSAGIGTESCEALAGCNCRTGTAGRTARNVFCIPRVFRYSECRSLCGASHGELIHVCLSENHHSCLRDPCDCRRVVKWNKIFKDL